MMDLKEVQDFIMENMGMLNGIDRTLFMPLICMMMEEWCAANEEDVVKMAREISEVVEMVNHTYGKYAGGSQMLVK